MRPPLPAKQFCFSPTLREKIIGHGIQVDTVGGTVPLDIPRLKGFQPLPGGRTALRRSYPISDFLEIALGSGEGWGHVNSFLYYDRNTLFIADVDSEVEVVGPSGVREPDPVSIWTSETGSAVLRAAALPYKDYPEQDLRHRHSRRWHAT